MKTLKFRLLATIITLAAVTTSITNPVNAQRRSTTNSTNNERVENSSTGNRNNIEKKSGHREVAKEPQANRSVKSTREVKRYNAPVPIEKRREDARVDSRSGENSGIKSKRIVTDKKLNENQPSQRERSSSNRTSSNNYAERYNHNTSDVRYNTSREYRGSNKYWSVLILKLML